MTAKGKLVVAGCVLTVGLLVAMCFRHEQTGGATGFDSPQPLVITSAPETQPPLQLWPVPRSRQPMNRALPGASANPRMADSAVDPFDSAEPPPDLAPGFPGGTSSPATTQQQSSPNPFAVQVHKVVDGDTLAALAERYLGCADRAGEIYQLNRDRLLSPALLPIGVELRIPMASSDSGRQSTAAPYVAKSPTNLMPRLPPTQAEQ